ncbi:DegQ family serine endoprotease [Inhella gelatinilytica]|uniref:Probable periplasmic serine endoprotease DegP-like n=1 Tax=Inhella gelatinilytica TaxID=2795030 RepID=A0A931J0J1_9BURK|nr:DegQ family serine endoprotease [Inhella gelatinilytica]MBH9553298.1 DegQ family serine endoprotease [Inhella gelatinilytica]
MKSIAVRTGLATLAVALSLIQGGAAHAQNPNLPDFTELVERVGPAVVNIRTSERVRGMPGGEMDPQMQEFLRRFGLPGGRRPQPRGEDDEAPQRRGVGSGFILAADGVVLTNAHVVEGADEVIVTLTDKREFRAKVSGLDRRTDVAVLKIDAQGLPSVRLGDVNRLKVGEWVLAIGSPFGFESTVTAGIVSAKARDTGEFLPFIQTDVAINPGNSGGPLLNMRGEVVGINSQIYSQSGGFMGISFAIPIDEAMRVADQLRASGKVVRGRIGVAIGPVTKEVADAMGLAKPQGAWVSSVEAGSPAEKAGVEGGDVILKFDGKTIERSTDLPRLVGAARPGSKAQLQVFRRGASKDLSVTVAELKESPGRGQADASEAARAAGGLGLILSDLTESQRKELRVRGGIRIDGAEGPAARAGLREGDVILSVENTEISSVKQFQSLVSKADRNKVLSLVVRRGDVTSFVLIRPGK